MRFADLPKKACKVATRHKRIYHGSHALAHMTYLGTSIYEGHGIGVIAVGMVSILAMWQTAKEYAAKEDTLPPQSTAMLPNSATKGDHHDRAR